MGLGESMTKVNDEEVKCEEGLSKRLHRRSLLKAGAVVAPIALTLHGGVPLAHADSAGLCVVQLMDIARDSTDSRHAMLQIPMKGGKIIQPEGRLQHAFEVVQEDYPEGTELQPFDASNQQHWEFIKDPINGRFGHSCMASVVYSSNVKGI